MDLRFKYDALNQEFDLGIENNELEFDDGLETAVLVSLYSDARAEVDELPIGQTSRRGFWGDAVENPDKVNTGSKLWLLDRAKTTDELLEQVREYCEAALQWLVDDAIAESVTVETRYLDKFSMAIEITIARPQGEKQPFKYGYVWEVRSNGIRTAYA